MEPPAIWAWRATGPSQVPAQSMSGGPSVRETMVNALELPRFNLPRPHHYGALSRPLDFDVSPCYRIEWRSGAIL
jgi:hypothetical protein